MEPRVFYKDRNRLDAALPLARDVVSGFRGTSPENDRVLARALNLLGSILQSLQRDLDEAEQAFRDVLEIRHRTDGPESPETVYATDNLGQFLCLTNRLDEGEPFLREALAYFCQSPGTG